MSKIEIKKSKIHGWGVFSIEALSRDTLVPVLSENYKGYEKFRGFNRSCNPNGWMSPIDDEVYLVRNIMTGEEITLGYPIKKCKCSSCKV
jgi:hypothetical protein